MSATIGAHRRFMLLTLAAATVLVGFGTLAFGQTATPTIVIPKIPGVEAATNPREVATTLERKGLEHEPGREGAYRFLTTGDPETFRALGERFLQLPLGEVERVAVAELERAAA